MHRTPLSFPLAVPRIHFLSRSTIAETSSFLPPKEPPLAEGSKRVKSSADLEIDGKDVNSFLPMVVSAKLGKVKMQAVKEKLFQSVLGGHTVGNVKIHGNLFF